MHPSTVAGEPDLMLMLPRRAPCAVLCSAPKKKDATDTPPNAAGLTPSAPTHALWRACDHRHGLLLRRRRQERVGSGGRRAAGAAAAGCLQSPCQGDSLLRRPCRKASSPAAFLTEEH